MLLQGWRLDPLLLFCQLLTAGTALGFAIESLKLRQAVRDIQARPPHHVLIVPREAS